MARPLVGLSLMLEDDFRQAAYPLFENGDIDVLEWSFDTAWHDAGWATELIDFYSAKDRLLGHGVSYSVLSAGFHDRQRQWLERLSVETGRRRYRHVSEHFGFLTAGSFHEGAPLPVPCTPETIEIGRAHLRRLREAAGVPIGLENLAFAFGARDVAEQGAFLEALLAPVDGFVLLDLHNIYCQMCNFDCDAATLLHSYPLQRVRELHISGGSWSLPTQSSSRASVRRDTHDGPVPGAVFDLVARALRLCPNVEAVIFERLGATMGESDYDAFRGDFYKLRDTVQAAADA